MQWKSLNTKTPVQATLVEHKLSKINTVRGLVEPEHTGMAFWSIFSSWNGVPLVFFSSSYGIKLLKDLSQKLSFRPSDLMKIFFGRDLLWTPLSELMTLPMSPNWLGEGIPLHIPSPSTSSVSWLSTFCTSTSWPSLLVINFYIHYCSF